MPLTCHREQNKCKPSSRCQLSSSRCVWLHLKSVLLFTDGRNYVEAVTVSNFGAVECSKRCTALRPISLAVPFNSLVWAPIGYADFTCILFTACLILWNLAQVHGDGCLWAHARSWTWNREIFETFLLNFDFEFFDNWFVKNFVGTYKLNVLEIPVWIVITGFFSNFTLP